MDLNLEGARQRNLHLAYARAGWVCVCRAWRRVFRPVATWSTRGDEITLGRALEGRRVISEGNGGGSLPLRILSA